MADFLAKLEVRIESSSQLFSCQPQVPDVLLFRILQEEEAKLAESSTASGAHTESDSFRTKLQLASANSPTLDELDLKFVPPQPRI